MAETLRGLGVSPGRAAGRVYRMAGPPLLPAPAQAVDADRALSEALSALRATAAELAARAEKAPDTTSREILEAQSFIAEDPGLHESVEEGVRAGMDAAHAIDAACAHHRRALLEAGGYFAERAADLDDIRNRAVAVVLGLPLPGVPDPGHPFVLVAEDLAPADTVNLDPSVVLALLTEKGGPTSHTAILARARGLPAVVACRGVTGLDDGTWVSVDGARGEVETGIGEEAAAEIRRQAIADRRRSGTSHGPGRTSDDHPVKLLLNIGSAADLGPVARSSRATGSQTDLGPAAQGAGATGSQLGQDASPDPAGEGRQGVDAEGVGLFRTEFLFLNRREEPGYEEQVAAYEAVFRAAPGGHVVIRTLDAGTDKPLPFLGLPSEPNPALGVRGLRVSRVRPEVLDTQLDAIAEAARAAGIEPWVMAPMVTTVSEAANFAARARARGITHVGAMVEVPAAALRGGRLLKELDFLSIGTNDLSQYTFASDRQHGELADLLDPWQAALLQLIADCAAAGQAVGKPVGVCGEAAADPLLATVLTGLGVSSLSMSAPSIAPVRDSLAAHSLAQCRDNARLALGADDPAQARKLVMPG